MIVCFASSVCLLWATAVEARTAATDQAFQQAAALVAPSVVRIDTVGGRAQLDSGIVAAGATTGLIVSADGDIVSSAFHFLSDPTSVLVTLADGRRLPARRVATDKQRMITLLKVDAQDLAVPIAAPIDSFRVGQWALALGRTFDADSPSVSVGIISALNRVWGKALQTDAKVSPVNYGGPLIDIEGRVLGVLVPLSPHESGESAGVEWYDSGIGFAVPLVDILSVVDRLKEGEDLLPGLLGVTFKGKDLIGGLPIVDQVRYGSPAEASGMRAGDRIVAIDDHEISRLAEMRHVLGSKYAGDQLQMTVLRDEKRLPLDVTLVGKLTPYRAPFLGIQPDRAPLDNGVRIRFVWPQSAAAQAGLKPGDIVEQVQGTAVRTRAEVIEQLSRIKTGGAAKLDVRRGGEQRPIELVPAGPPEALPADVPPQAAWSTAEKPADLKTGRLAETLAGHDREYWMYVPDSYRPDRPHALALVLHPALNPMEQSILDAWREECERRGIIVLAPRAAGPGGWNPTDLPFLVEAIAKVREQYSIAPERIAVIGLDNSAPAAALLAFREGELIRGLALLQSPPLGEVPENSPERNLQVLSVTRDGSVETAKWNESITSLRDAGYCAFHTTAAWDQGQYLPAAVNAVVAQWLDSLDRL